MDYGFEHNGKVFTPNGTQGLDVQTMVDRNKAIEQAELSEWAQVPDRQLAYYTMVAPTDTKPPFRTHGCVSTWLGTQIGQVTTARVYRHNLGGRFVSMTVKGSNGATYYGRASYDNGSSVWLRRAGSRLK